MLKNWFSAVWRSFGHLWHNLHGRSWEMFLRGTFCVCHTSHSFLPGYHKVSIFLSPHCSDLICGNFQGQKRWSEEKSESNNEIKCIIFPSCFSQIFCDYLRWYCHLWSFINTHLKYLMISFIMGRWYVCTSCSISCVYNISVMIFV